MSASTTLTTTLFMFTLPGTGLLSLTPDPGFLAGDNLPPATLLCEDARDAEVAAGALAFVTFAVPRHSGRSLQPCRGECERVLR